MKKKWIAVIGSGVLIVGIAVAGLSYADADNSEVRNGTIRVDKHAEADFPSMAKISMDQATQKALAAVNGQVLKTELEDENGFLVYGVEVVSADKSIMEVKVDAGSGKVLATERDKKDEEDRDFGKEDESHDEDGAV
ncbi:Peptidase propeptide and ypeb domain protein [Desulfosarcina cetonica]|uniref:PepSY domain-containing protein n=1 Tax=Desulfosarcina cetonica TaxID=90730 RepID=UPI0006D201ED|nr:PepSY domain-containing protein [Desulfosarcina cetonica]VTR71428.1 Peptidase propeptide and ypeb domain protein [Desulfosarcina cetonica]